MVIYSVTVVLLEGQGDCNCDENQFSPHKLQVQSLHLIQRLSFCACDDVEKDGSKHRVAAQIWHPCTNLLAAH